MSDDVSIASLVNNVNKYRKIVGFYTQLQPHCDVDFRQLNAKSRQSTDVESNENGLDEPTRCRSPTG